MRNILILRDSHTLRAVEQRLLNLAGRERSEFARWTVESMCAPFFRAVGINLLVLMLANISRCTVIRFKDVVSSVPYAISIRPIHSSSKDYHIYEGCP